MGAQTDMHAEAVRATRSDSRKSRRLLRRLALLAVAGVLLAFAARIASRPATQSEAERMSALMALAPAHFKNALPGFELIDVEVRFGSQTRVAYEHDELFDVEFVYRVDGATKTFTAPYGRKGGTWITPTSVELLSRDESALLVDPGG